MNRHRFEIDIPRRGVGTTIKMDGNDLDGVVSLEMGRIDRDTVTTLTVEMVSTAVINMVGRLNLTGINDHDSTKLADLMFLAMSETKPNGLGEYKVIGDPELQALAERFLALLIEESSEAE